MSNESKTTFKVWADKLDGLRDGVATINKRVERLRRRGYDVEPVVIEVGKLFAEKVQTKIPGTDRVVERENVFAMVELRSPKPPKIDGWEFVAVLSHVEDVGTVLRVCPGATVAEGEMARYREASPENCDHCRVRRARSDTFIIRNREGELKQVGRQCLAAYTGLENPEALCAAAEVLFAVSRVLEGGEDEPGGEGGSGRSYCSIASYLPYVACSIRVDGWLSRTAAREQGSVSLSTADQALSRGIFAGPDTRDRYVPEERDYNLASAVVEFCEDHFAGCDVASLTDYENSLRVAMAATIVHPKLVGLVASAVGFYQRDLERRARAESWAAMVAKSRFQGELKERRVFEDLKVLACRSWGGDYGVTHFYSLVDESGNAFVYFASRDLDLCPGQVVAFKATVKKHDVRTSRDGRFPPYQQTVLTRCSLVARARLVSVVVVESYQGKLEVTNPEEVARGEYAQYRQVMEKLHVYHFEGLDGRKYVHGSKARKKALVPGVVAHVEYVVEDLSARNGGERPVSIAGLLST